MKARPISEISINELLQYGVWEFDLDEENYTKDQDESWIRPVYQLPVTSLSNRIVFSDLKLANKGLVAGLLGNINLNNIEKTKVFICVSVNKNNKWFHLERYFDVAYDRYGPKQLAEFIGLSLHEVFPITYDISSLVVGDERVLKGSIMAEPEIRLSDDEIMKLLK